jgi:hypothetical protein
MRVHLRLTLPTRESALRFPELRDRLLAQITAHGEAECRIAPHISIPLTIEIDCRTAPSTASALLPTLRDLVAQDGHPEWAARLDVLDPDGHLVTSVTVGTEHQKAWTRHRALLEEARQLARTIQASRETLVALKSVSPAVPAVS